MKLFITFLICFSFAFNPIRDEFDDEKAPLNPTTLSDKEAIKLFDEFKAMDHIPYDYPIDGCYARATAMARLAESKGIDMSKIYAEGFLRVRTNDKRYDPVEWGWHVAPAIYVKKNNQTVLMVFDPSLFNNPVPVEDWLEIMKTQIKDHIPASIDKVYYGSKYQYFTKDAEQKKWSWMKEDLTNGINTMKQYLQYARPNSSSSEQLKSIQRTFQ